MHKSIIIRVLHMSRRVSRVAMRTQRSLNSIMAVEQHRRVQSKLCCVQLRTDQIRHRVVYVEFENSSSVVDSTHSVRCTILRSREKKPGFGL